MKVVFTFAELEALQNTMVGLNDQLLSVIPGFKDQLKESKSILVALLDTQKKAPELVYLDMLNATITITVPETVVIESISVVGLFYEEIVEMIPFVLAVMKMAKKAMSRYEANVLKLAEKFKKLVKSSD